MRTTSTNQPHPFADLYKRTQGETWALAKRAKAGTR